MNLLCKVFNFFLNLFAAVLNVAVEAATMLLGAAFTVLDAAASGLLSNPLVLGLGALALFWLLPGDDDEPRTV